MKFKITTLSICIALMCWIITSCKSPNVIDGPELNQLYGPFEIKSNLALSTKTVDFAAGQTVALSLSLSKVNNWTVTISGLSSGAKKIFSGRSNALDVSNATWNGSTTLFPIFKREKCAIAISFEGQTLVVYDTVTIASPKNKDNGTVLVAFAPADLGKLFVNRYIDYSVDGDSIAISNAAPFTPYLGSHSLIMSGIDKSNDTYIGNVVYTSTLFGATPYFNVSSSDPNDVYFNMAINGGGLPNSRVIVQLAEDSNGDKRYTAAADNMYQIDIPITWSGWKMFSAKYSDFVVSNGALPAPGLPKDPSKILQIGFIHMTAAAGTASRVVMDYPILTVGKAFEP